MTYFWVLTDVFYESGGNRTRKASYSMQKNVVRVVCDSIIKKKINLLTQNENFW